MNSRELKVVAGEGQPRLGARGDHVPCAPVALVWADPTEVLDLVFSTHVSLFSPAVRDGRALVWLSPVSGP